MASKKNTRKTDQRPTGARAYLAAHRKDELIDLILKEREERERLLETARAQGREARDRELEDERAEIEDKVKARVESQQAALVAQREQIHQLMSALVRWIDCVRDTYTSPEAAPPPLAGVVLSTVMVLSDTNANPNLVWPDVEELVFGPEDEGREPDAEAPPDTQPSTQHVGACGKCRERLAFDKDSQSYRCTKCGAPAAARNTPREPGPFQDYKVWKTVPRDAAGAVAQGTQTQVTAAWSLVHDSNGPQGGAGDG